MQEGNKLWNILMSNDFAITQRVEHTMYVYTSWYSFRT